MSRCTCRMPSRNSLAPSPWVISFFLVFFNATSRSLSTWVISSCPSCIPKAWGCQDDISTLLKDDILILLPLSFATPVLRHLSFAKNASADMSLRGNAFITVMQTAELRDLDDPADTRDLSRNHCLSRPKWVLDP